MLLGWRRLACDRKLADYCRGTAVPCPYPTPQTFENRYIRWLRLRLV
ncbi:MAG TPA: hypothetical protein V6D48_12390 [Oculatellaceae cyanobacterium]